MCTFVALAPATAAEWSSLTAWALAVVDIANGGETPPSTRSTTPPSNSKRVNPVGGKSASSKSAQIVAD
jgi:hypothetical protein